MVWASKVLNVSNFGDYDCELGVETSFHVFTVVGG